MSKEQRGFTLIELLVVVAIIALLAIIVVLTINPAELLRQSRDSTRLSDLGTLKAAISLYLSDGTSPSLAGNYNSCYQSNFVAEGSNCGVFSSNITVAYVATSTTAQKVDGNGWVPVNFLKVTSGAPLSILPLDPVNDATYYYAYAASSSLTFEIDAKMESSRYKNGGANDVESKDGGDNPNEYEVGTAPGLSL